MDNDSVRKVDKKLSDEFRNKKKNAKPEREITGWENHSYQSGKGDKNRLPGWYDEDITEKLNRIYNK